MATCSKCGARIVWLKTPKGKWMCADEGLVPYRRNPEGKSILVNDYGEMIRCDTYPAEKGLAEHGMARVPHWATCPNAEDFQRAKKGGATE